MRRAACPGSFDPVTNGHIDIIGRAALLFDEVVVAVGVNASKNRLFSPDERMDMLREAVEPWPNVKVDGFSGLLTDFCQERDIGVLVKGLRAVSDFDYELQMAQMNSSLAPVETVFVPDEPGVLLPRLEPGQGGRHLRRRRLRAGPAPRAGPAHRAAGARARPERRGRRFCGSRPPGGTLDDGPCVGALVGMGIVICLPTLEVILCVSTRERRSCSTPASSAAARGRSDG